MPYIKLTERRKFHEVLTDVLALLKDSVDTLYIRGEYLGFFWNRLCRSYLGQGVDANSFNSANFNVSKKKTLINAADKLVAILNQSDPLASAGDLNYCISSVLWGFLGDAEGIDPANYGLRAYLTGILDRIGSDIESTSRGSQGDVTMSFRRHIIIRGVLHNVLSEVYRRHMVSYEDQKTAENGDIWDSGRLVV